MRGQTLFNLMTLGFTFGLCLIGGTTFGITGVGIGFAAWVLLVGALLRFLILVVPEATALVTVNLFTGNYYGYGTPGIKFKYPWEKVNKSNFFSLKTVTTVVKSETLPAKD